MYHKRLEYLQTKYPEQQCASAMLGEDYNGTMAGTPCLIKTGAFYPYLVKHNVGKKIYVLENIPSGKLKEIGIPTDRPPRKVHTELGLLRKAQSEGLIKLGDMQEVIKTCGITLRVSTLAPTGGMLNVYESLSFMEFNLPGRHVVYRDKTPIIYDSIQEVSASDLRNIYSEGELENFPEIIDGTLGTDVRSMNITLTDVKASRIGDICTSITDIINRMSNAYPHNVCMMCPEKMSSIIDVVSISFYDLDDFIPIFDVKKGRSIAIEVLFTNSEFNPVSVAQNSILYSFAFAKQRENLFVIDGEPISRPLDVSTPLALKSMLATLASSVPNDVKKLKKKTTDRRKQVCAE